MVWVERLKIPLAVLLVLSVWQAVASADLVNPKYMPDVPRVGEAFWGMLASGELWRGNSLTLTRAALGLMAASLLGVALAILSDLYPVFGRGFRYISDLLQPIPPAAIVPMAVFALGLGFKLYAFIIILVTVWPPYMNGVAALAATSPVQVNAGRMLGLGPWELLWRIKLPAALPEIFSGIRYAATIAILAVVVSEMLAGRDGLGFMIFKKAFALRTPEVFALMFVVAANGMALNGFVNVLRRKLTGWHMQMMVRQE